MAIIKTRKIYQFFPLYLFILLGIFLIFFPFFVKAENCVISVPEDMSKYCLYGYAGTGGLVRGTESRWSCGCILSETCCSETDEITPFHHLWHTTRCWVDLPDSYCSEISLSAPVDLKIFTSCVGTNPTISLSWGVVMGAAGYVVSDSTGREITTTTSNSIDITSGLSEQTTYSYYVKSHDSSGNPSPASETVSVTTPNCQPPPPVTTTTTPPTTTTTPSSTQKVVGECAPPAVLLQIPILGVKCVKDLTEYIKLVYQWVIGALTLLAVVMIMIAGIQWIFAAGNASKISEAKSRISNAIFGLLLAIFAYVILSAINPELVALRMPGVEKIIPVNQELVKAKEICPPTANIECGKIEDLQNNEECIGVFCQENPFREVRQGIFNVGQVCKLNRSGLYYSNGECVERISVKRSEGEVSIVEDYKVAVAGLAPYMVGGPFLGLPMALTNWVGLTNPACGRVSLDLLTSAALSLYLGENIGVSRAADIVGGSCEGEAKNQCYVIYYEGEIPNMVSEGGAITGLLGMSRGKVMNMQCNTGHGAGATTSGATSTATGGTTPTPSPLTTTLTTGGSITYAGHTIILDTIGTDSADFTVHSSETNITIRLGETVQVQGISITLNSISGSTVSITLSYVGVVSPANPFNLSSPAPSGSPSPLTQPSTSCSFGQVSTEPETSAPGTIFALNFTVTDSYFSSLEEPITARIKYPGDSGQEVASIRFYDDGQHGDGRENDKVYANIWDSSGYPAGIYTIDISTRYAADTGHQCPNCHRLSLVSGALCKELIAGQNSNGADRVNVVFVGTNYNDKQTFINSAQTNAQTLLSLSPFSGQRNKFNFWYVDRLGNVQNNSDGFCNGANLGNFSTCTSIVSELADECSLSNKQIVGLLNQNFRSAATGFGSGEALISCPGGCDGRILTHEFGHSFGGLGDEYVDESTYGSLASFFFGIGSLPNIDDFGCDKWGCTGTTQPNPPADGVGGEQNFGICPSGLGCYHGAGRWDYYRSFQCGIMRHCPDAGYGPVSEQHLQDLLDGYSGT